MTKAQHSVCLAVARHFKIVNGVVVDEAKEYLQQFDENYPVIELHSGNYNYKNSLRFGASKSTIPIGKMMFYNLLEKTELFSDVQNLLKNEEVEFVAFFSGGALLGMYECAEYSGEGGIFVKKEGELTGYVIEPVKHFLKQHHPVYSED